MNQPISQPNSDPSKIIRFGLSVIFIVFGIFFGWMALAPLATSVVAVGQISADTNKKTVQHLEGGIIREIFVKEGDLVLKGDKLISLDSTQLEASLSTLQNQYFESIASLARLQAQENFTDIIEFPKQLVELSSKEYIQNIINDQKRILAAKIKSKKEENLVTQKKIKQLNNQVDSLEFMIKSNKLRLDSIKLDLKEQQALYDEKLVDILKLRELEREKIRLKGDINSKESEVLKVHAQIEEVQSTQRLRDKEYFNEIALQKSEKNIQKVDLFSKIKSAKDKLSRIIITSPTTGFITGLQLHTIGGVISPSKPILDIVPKDSELFIIAQVNTPDIDKLRLGLKADTRFSAFNVQQTYVVESEVKHISADTFTDEKTGMSYYEVKLQLTEDGEIQLQENKFFLLPGMPAEVMINVGDRTTLSYLVKPFMDMLSRSFNEE